MRPQVDRDICTGCGMCVDVCPEVFTLDDTGLARTIRDEPDPEQYDLIREATEVCPVVGISIEVG